jgi:hypothetical protein
MSISGIGSVFGGLVKRGIQKIPEILGNILPLAGGRFGRGGTRAEGGGMPSALSLF